MAKVDCDIKSLNKNKTSILNIHIAIFYFGTNNRLRDEIYRINFRKKVLESRCI